MVSAGFLVENVSLKKVASFAWLLNIFPNHKTFISSSVTSFHLTLVRILVFLFRNLIFVPKDFYRNMNEKSRNEYSIFSLHFALVEAVSQVFLKLVAVM